MGSKSDLERALDPVREYFSGKEINKNTVLAAYLRSEGIPASGQPWQRAKLALQEGKSFQEAILAAGHEAEARQGFVPVETSSEPTPFSGDSLGWFPKQFSPGDLDGVGAKRLLGTPDLDPVWVLVRETAQNSWDARGKSTEIDFTLNLRMLKADDIQLLRERVFTGDAPETGLPQLLSEDSIWALEISDRGTVGLGGPIRNDLAVDPGEDTNFIDLVFNIGAPRDVHLGAGTYGFGKTISYVVSSVGTILISSRCEGSRGREQRLIGSAIGDGFNMGGYRYTGRHWWGNAIPGENRVEPVTGSVAEELTELVFAEEFSKDSTGTSILILDPKLGDGSPEIWVRNLVDAVVWNLWPKLLTDQRGRSTMRIHVQLNGKEVEIPKIENHGVLSGHAECLRAVRAVQSGLDLSSLKLKYPVDVHEVRSERPRKLLGHLALTRYPVPHGTDEPSRWVTLMRNQAELVVKYMERQPLDVGGFQWAGVFKPVTEVDDSFALSEPPAHDDWVPKAVEDKALRRDVNIALDRIQKFADAFVRPSGDNSNNGGPVQSAAAAGDALAGLLSGLPGSRPSRRRVSVSGGSRPPKPRVEVVNTGSEVENEGWIRTWVEIQLAEPATKSAIVDVILRVGVDGGSEDDAEVIRVIGLRTSNPGEYENLPATIHPREIRCLEFESRSDIAVDLDVKVLS